MPNKFYLTTTLPYVNADPHIGFALELVQADIVARYKRLLGDEVFFSTGTDEHGQKIWEAAQKNGQDVKEYVDHYAAEFRKLKSALNISNDTFIRTTDPEHIKAAQEIWKKCEEKDDIELREFSGLYCVGCEAYKTKRDLTEDGHCLIHSHLELKEVNEKNYFFKFSKYQEKLLEYLNRPESIVPEWRRQEAINFVKEGLEDFSISRQASQLSWGIPVPGNDTQVMYVWFDALTNYISTLGWPEDKEEKFKKFWQEGTKLQFAGKDQVRFQSLMWQAMLMSADIKNTDKVIYHGFINSGGQKMSKSLGNVINPLDLVEEYKSVTDFSADVMRYFLARHVSTFEDSDVTLERFKEAYNAGLANGLGNLVSRVMKMAVDNNIRVDYTSVFVCELQSRKHNFDMYMRQYKIDKACDEIWAIISWCDAFIQENQPFKVIKTDFPKGEEMIGKVLLRQLDRISDLLVPIMPATSVAIKQLVKENKMPEKPLFLRK